MKNAAFAFSFALPFMLALTAPASAQKLDLEKVKCSEWLKAPPEVIGMTLAWIDGYYMDQDADPVIDFDKLTRNSKKLAEACAKAPDKTLGDVAEDLFG